MFEISFTLNPKDYYLTCTAFSPDGNKVAVGSNNGYVFLFETENFTMLQSKCIHKGAINDINWSLDGNYILTASDDMTLILINESNFEQRVYSDFEKQFVKCNLSKTGSYICGVTIEQLIVLWNENPYECSNFELAHSDLITGLQFSNDEKSLLTSSLDGLLRIWDIETFYLLKTISFKNPISASLFDPFENFVLVSTLDSKIHLIDFYENKTLGYLTGHTNKKKISSLKIISPTKLMYQVITQDDNGTIFCWDLRTQDLLWKFLPNRSYLIPFNITNKGNILITTSKNGTMQFWKRRN